MKVANPPSRLITVTPSHGLRIALVVAAVLLCLLIFTQFMLRPTSSLYGPVIWHASYRGEPLSTVIEDLEKAKLIPPGTAWVDESLKTRPVTLRWLIATPDEVVEDLAAKAKIQIEYPSGYHGNMIGPVRVGPAGPSGGRVVARVDRVLEDQQRRDRSQAPN